MAIDFSQVKALTIPEGDVKSISIGGVVVWQKPQEQSWHTIWSGSKSFGVTFNGNSGTPSGTGDLVSTSTLKAGVPTKITFTTSAINSSSKITRRGTSSGSWSVTSPQEFTSAALGQDLLFGNIYHSSTLYCSYNFSLYTDGNGKIGIWIGNINSSTTSLKSCDITLKKIEQYY